MGRRKKGQQQELRASLTADFPDMHNRIAELRREYADLYALDVVTFEAVLHKALAGMVADGECRAAYTEAELIARGVIDLTKVSARTARREDGG